MPRLAINEIDDERISNAATHGSLETCSARVCIETTYSSSTKFIISMQQGLQAPWSCLSCPCSNCKYVNKYTSHWTKTRKEEVDVGIRIGDRVLVQGTFPGVVKYVGDLDSEYINDQIYIGIKLDDPGKCNL